MQDAKEQKKIDKDEPPVFSEEEMRAALEETALSEVEEEKKSFIVQDVKDMSELVGLPSNFIMLLGGKPYVTKAGLYWKAEQKGYRNIETHFILDDRDKQDYIVEARLYPHLNKDDYALLSEILKNKDRDLFTETFDKMTRPFIVQRQTNPNNVKMKEIHPHMRNMAQTRAIDEAMRLFTGCGFRASNEED